MKRGARTAYDELIELRQVLKASEIAEIVRRSPESISRINADRNLRPETEAAIDALHYVVQRLLRGLHGDRKAVRWALLRRREELNGQRVADLLRTGRMEEALQVLEASGDASTPLVADAAGLRVDPQLEEDLLRIEHRPIGRVTEATTDPVEDYLARHPELNDLIPSLVMEVGQYLGAADYDSYLLADDTGAQELVVTFRPEIGLEEANDRMRAFYADRWDALLAPYSDKIGIAVE
jgi:hypothetical protein